MSEGNHWRSRIEIVTAKDLGELQDSVNEFCSDTFVVGIQYPDSLQFTGHRVAVISYKVQEKPESE